MDTATTLLAIKPLHYQGQQLFKELWSPLVQELRAALQTLGFEESESSDALLLFTFNHPSSAITTTISHASKIRRDYAKQLNGSSLPFQIIIHLPSGNEINSPFRNPDAKLWEMVEADIIHVSKPLKSVWEVLMAKSNLPPCTLSKEGDGLFKVMMATEESFIAKTILACRNLPVQGTGQPCFYCSMPSHLPGQCPSKLLTIEHSGLDSVGYLPFDQIATAFEKAFTNVTAMTKLLAEGITQTSLRKSSLLMVFVGFFDVYRIYQPRFLYTIAFSRYSKWQSLFKTATLKPDNKNLHLGFDSLRVGQYGQAEEFLMRECQAKSPRRFTATIGMAFVCLEQRGLANMRSHLELAKSLAIQPKEHIYIDFLLSRFYELIGEVWKARDIIKNLTTSQLDCSDGIYRKLQLEAKGNFNAEASQLLRTLMVDQRNLFMAALIDPALIPIQTKVEDLLLSQYGIMVSSAQDSLVQAEYELENLTFWCDNNDPQIHTAQTTFDTLHKRFQQKSYFSVIDVEHKTKVLLASLRQFREEKLNDLYDQITKAKAQWGEYARFWEEYRYHKFFKSFIQRLNILEKPLKEAGELAKKNEGDSYRQAIELIRTAEKTLGELALVQERMNWTTLVWDGVASFTKKLAITEIAGILLVTSAVFGLEQLPKSGSPEGFLSLANDPMFLKKATSLTAFLIAPLLALSWTIKNQIQT